MSRPNAHFTLACEKFIGSDDTMKLQTQALIGVDLGFDFFIFFNRPLGARVHNDIFQDT